jgi:hypothetical protein
MASAPLEANIPGVRAMKFVIDRMSVSDEYPYGHVYFQNSKRYGVHSEFINANKAKLGIKSDTTSDFEYNYYGGDDRLFLLGSISYYEGPGVWAVDLAGYDTATAKLIQEIFDAITPTLAFFRPALVYHPYSTAQATVANDLALSIPVVTTEDLYKGIDYQPLSLATTMGRLTFLTANDVSSGTFIPYDSIVVLDQAPNDISVVAGIITEQFQSTLSHINVLSRNRKTPNMGLRGALTNEKLLKYKDQFVELTVGSEGWDVQPVTDQQAQDYYNAHKPTPVTLPAMDLEPRDLVNVEDLVPGYIALNDDSTSTKETVRAVIKKIVNAYGGKTVNYAIMAQIAELPLQKAFGIPIYYYEEFMQNNGFYDMVDSYQANIDPITGEAINFTGDAYVRQEGLRDLRNAMMKGKIDQGLQDALKAKLAAEFVGPDGTPTKMRFRTSTNSEDLDNFPCAGCYESHTGDPANWEDVLDAIRLAYTSTWLFRTYEERSYYGVEHKSVGMSLLVHPYFPNETANGVAITTNINDLSQTSTDAYTINTAYGGDVEIVHPPEGVTTDLLLYYVNSSNNPITYLQNWNQPLPSDRTHVLTDVQVQKLATALTRIKTLFKKAYTLDSGWYAMDVEFKFAPQDRLGIPTTETNLWIKQARPYPDPNATSN